MKYWKQHFCQKTFFHQKMFHIKFYKQVYVECRKQGNLLALFCREKLSCEEESFHIFAVCV